MKTNAVILSLDQGTTSTRCLAVSFKGHIVAAAQRELPQHFPREGWVEHDGEQIWQDALFCLRSVIEQLGADHTPVAIGITNQRETTLIWDRKNGKPIYRAIVWQDRRTGPLCDQLKREGHEPTVTARTGLLLDPYFSASKAAWILDEVAGAREAAATGDLAFGTIESYLLWQLTGGKAHISDETNAARTSLWNIHTGTWDETLLELFQVPSEILPTVSASATDFGVSKRSLLGLELPILGMAGDQQSASFGQLCLSPGEVKATYGTGCFVLMNTGADAKPSTNKLLTTRACRIGAEPQFALEGSIFMAGAISQWLRDEMGLVADTAQTETLASSIENTGGVYLVPAFTGLGAPHWDNRVRAAIFGMTRQTGQAEIVRAALEAVAYQTADLMTAFKRDAGEPALIRVDGGMSANGWLMQLIADMIGVPLERPPNLETTAMGAAFLAGLGVGLWNSTDELRGLTGHITRFKPQSAGGGGRCDIESWHRAVRAAQVFSTSRP